MIRPLVYVAGPFTSSDHETQTRNVVAAVVEGYKVRALGAVPVVPHIAILPPAVATPEEAWSAAMAECLPLLQACAAVFAIPGWEKSRGARVEVVQAGEVGIPVFHDLETLGAFLRRSA